MLDERCTNIPKERFNGVLNLYFPCKLKNLQSLKKLNRKWERRDVSDTKHIHKSNRPLTDKIFVSSYIQRIESLLVDFKKGLGGYSYPYNEPHALKYIVAMSLLRNQKCCFWALLIVSFFYSYSNLYWANISNHFVKWQKKDTCKNVKSFITYD